MRTFVDPAAEFVPAVERVFGPARVVDSGRGALVGDIKLLLDAGERELWVLRMRSLGLEQRIAMVEVKRDVETALREAKGRVDELVH